MTSSRPYLIRAIHEWILDNDLTPHIVVDADADGVRVPPEYVKDGQISLNIASAAVQSACQPAQSWRFSPRKMARECPLERTSTKTTLLRAPMVATRRRPEKSPKPNRHCES